MDADVGEEAVISIITPSDGRPVAPEPRPSTAVARREETLQLFASAKTVGEKRKTLKTTREEAVPRLAETLAAVLFDADIWEIERRKVGVLRGFRRTVPMIQFWKEDPYYGSTSRELEGLYIDRGARIYEKARYKFVGCLTLPWDINKGERPLAEVIAAMVSTLESVERTIRRKTGETDSAIEALRQIIDAL